MYHKHVEYLQGELLKLCGVSYRLRPFMEEKITMYVYCACVCSKLTRCVSNWGGLLQDKQRGENFIKNSRIAGHSHVVCLYIYMFDVLKLKCCHTLQVNLNLKYPTLDHKTKLGNNAVLPFPRVSTIRINFRY